MKNFSTDKEVYQFQVACVSYIYLKQNKAFKEQIDKCLSTKFDIKTSARMIKRLKHDCTHSIALIMFYENRTSFILKVLGVVVYCFNDQYVFVDYLCIQIEAKFSLNHREFGDTSFYELSGIGIPEILLNIVSCYGYIKDENSTLILTWKGKLVSYYLSNVFVIIEKDYHAFNNVPQMVQSRIDAINMYESDSIMI